MYCLIPILRALDDKNHLIVDYDITNAPADNCQLSAIAKGAKETLNAERIDAGADKARANIPSSSVGASSIAFLRRLVSRTSIDTF